MARELVMRASLKWIIAAIALLLSVAGAGIYSGNRPLIVRVAPIEKDVPIQVFGLGTVEAETLSRIGFETAGTLVKLRADHGDTVKAGTLLARLDSL